MSGTFIAVVGASGAGKDSLIDHARGSLRTHRKFRFVTRLITRPADASGEQHTALTKCDFAGMKSAGAFVLSWEAHGNCYAIPTEAQGWIDDGKSVIANLSRNVLHEASEIFPTFRVIEVVAAPSTIANRLAFRQRESEAEIALRLSRETKKMPVNIDVMQFDNDKPLDVTGQEFVKLLLDLYHPAQPC